MFFRVRDRQPNNDTTLDGDTLTIEWSEEGGDKWETILIDQLFVPTEESAREAIDRRAMELTKARDTSRPIDVAVGAEIRIPDEKLGPNRPGRPPVSGGGGGGGGPR